MSTNNVCEYDFGAIIARIMEAKGWKNEKDVASALGMKPVAFSGRKSRNSPPIDKIRVWCQSESLNIDWVLTGEGEMLVTPITGTSREGLSFSEKSGGSVGASSDPIRQAIERELDRMNRKQLAETLTYLVSKNEEDACCARTSQAGED
jgi:transcriptional regulator with XRE-family HTH domain